MRIKGGGLKTPVLQTMVRHAGDEAYRLLHTVALSEGWCEDFGRDTPVEDKPAKVD